MTEPTLFFICHFEQHHEKKKNSVLNCVAIASSCSCKARHFERKAPASLLDGKCKVRSFPDAPLIISICSH